MKPELVQDEDPEPPGTTPKASSSIPVPEPQVRPAAQPTLQPVPASKPAVPRLTISPRGDAFRRRFYRDATARDWNDWRWQNRNRVRTLADLARMIRLTDEEMAAIQRHEGPLPIGITPYYASLLDEHDATQALRRHGRARHGRVHPHPRRSGRSARRGRPQPDAGSRASLSRSRAAARHGLLFGSTAVTALSRPARRRHRRDAASRARSREAIEYIAATPVVQRCPHFRRRSVEPR